MRRTIQRATAVTVLASAAVFSLGGLASASTTTVVTAEACPPGYKGVFIKTTAAGDAFICENII